MLTQENTDESVIDYTHRLIDDAIQSRASDLHIEPYESHSRVRIRVDGFLREKMHIPLSLSLRIITRFKMLAKLDVSERRLPQDGHFHTAHPHIHARVSTCPTVFGEKLVMRFLDASQMCLRLDKLGFTETQLQLVNQKLKQPQGLILVTGPTGSGKTMTLYSALQSLNQPERNISTVEDPVEMYLPGVNQMTIQPKIGLDYPTILRALLRQDPDILMIGEIRDRQTAEMAIQAAQTGHLVLATVHAHYALDTLYRLQSLDIPARMATHAISLIIAQRLIRQRCENSYTHRTAIYECLTLNDPLIDLIHLKRPYHALLTEAKRNGFHTLHDAAKDLIEQNITDQAEIERVLS